MKLKVLILGLFVFAFTAAMQAQVSPRKGKPAQTERTNSKENRKTDGKVVSRKKSQNKTTPSRKEGRVKYGDNKTDKPVGKSKDAQADRTTPKVKDTAKDKEVRKSKEVRKKKTAKNKKVKGDRATINDRGAANQGKYKKGKKAKKAKKAKKNPRAAQNKAAVSRKQSQKAAYKAERKAKKQELHAKKHQLRKEKVGVLRGHQKQR